MTSESNNGPSKVELVQLVNQFLIQNDLPVTAAALQKECEKLLGGRWNRQHSTGTRSGRLRRHTTAIPSFDGDACLAEWLSDSGAMNKITATSPIEMTNSSSKSPPSSHLRKPAKTISTTLKKGESQNLENKTEKILKKQTNQTPSTYNNKQQKRSNSRQNEEKNVSPTKLEQKQSGKVKNALRKSDSVGSISSNIATTNEASQQQQAPPPDPIQSSDQTSTTQDILIEDRDRWLCANLDFSLVSQTLLKQNVSGGRGSALLLQALRQMLTKTSLIDGDANISIFITKDLLQLRSRKQSIASAIFRDDSTLISDYVREQMARLLNVFASFRRGRDYLLCSTININSNTNANYGQGRQQLIYECSQILKGIRRPLLSQNASEQLLAALQKLSIRPAAQRELLINGIFEWLCSQLSQKKFGQAGLEFGIALLHNLVVNPLSQSMAIRHRNKLLDTLSILIGSAMGAQALQYTCATLYTLLCLPRVRQTAREATDVEHNLIERAKRERTLEQIRQLVVLKMMLRGELDVPDRRRQPTQTTTTSTDPLGEDTFPDYLEAEIDSTDSLVPGHGELFGKRLLIKNFLSRPLPPSIVKYYLPLSQFTIEEEGHRENVPGVVPVSRQPTVQASNGPLLGRFNASSPQKKPNNHQKRPPNKESLFTLKGEREGYVSGVLPLIRQVHFERTNTMSSHATFVVENNMRRPLLANNGFDNVIASLKGNVLIEDQCQKIIRQHFQFNENESDIEMLQNSCELLIIEEIPAINNSEEIDLHNVSIESTSAEAIVNKPIQRQNLPVNTTIARKPPTEVAKMFSSKLARTQNRKQEKRPNGEEREKTGCSGAIDELIEKSEEEIMQTAFAARPKLRRTPPKLSNDQFDEE